MCVGRFGVCGEVRCVWGGSVCVGRFGVCGEVRCVGGGSVCVGGIFSYFLRHFISSSIGQAIIIRRRGNVVHRLLDTYK